VLDHDVVFECSNLGTICRLAHHHHPVDALPASEELGLGNSATATASFAPITAALALCLEAGRPSNFLRLPRVRGLRGLLVLNEWLAVSSRATPDSLVTLGGLGAWSPGGEQSGVWGLEHQGRGGLSDRLLSFCGDSFSCLRLFFRRGSLLYRLLCGGFFRGRGLLFGLTVVFFFRVTIAGVLLTHSLAPLAGNTLRFGNARKHALKKLGCRGFSLYSDGHPRNLVVALRRLWRLR
jgi:hypothetical protein